MSNTYIIFERIAVQNANCVAGFTYGFPAITHFLGFSHALSREFSASDRLQLQDCAVICHHHQIHAYQTKGYGDYVFAQSKNPPVYKKHATKTPPITEEGKMNMCVSLVIACPNFTMSRKVEITELEKRLGNLAHQHHLAGGTITQIQAVHVITEKNEQMPRDIQMREIKRMLLPGFVLMDRSDLLNKHYQDILKKEVDTELIDAWLDFCSIKYKAKPVLKENQFEPNSETIAEWVPLDKLAKGWLVPIMNGYKAITSLYNPGEIANTRDSSHPFCFVEAVHSIGEWRSLHRIQRISEMLWTYHYEKDWYLCQQQTLAEAKHEIAVVDIDLNDLEDDFLNSL